MDCHTDAARRGQLTLAGAEGVYDLDRLDLKGIAAVLAEHGAHCVQHNLRLGEVCGCDLNEHIPSL